MFSLSYVKDRSKNKHIHKNKHDHVTAELFCGTWGKRERKRE
jgi:hypothetical protein